MSNYQQMTRHPETGQWLMADWIDDYFGRHRYGVRFGEGKVYEVGEIEGYDYMKMEITFTVAEWEALHKLAQEFDLPPENTIRMALRIFHDSRIPKPNLPKMREPLDG